ncbi:MAG: Rossmann-like and DUF2520 domain-containing protein [Saprospiraceae bacterium]
MRVAIIGTGNIAKSFGSVIASNGVDIAFILGRDFGRTKQVADQFNSPFSTDVSHLPSDLDMYLCCVNDDAIIQIVNSLSFTLTKAQVIIHFSGSISSSVLASKSKNYGVVWPIQSIHDGEDWMDATVVVTASNNIANNAINGLLSNLTSNCISSSDDQRLKMHLVAVILNNFTYYLFEQTYQYCDKQEIDITNFKAILQTTFQSMMDGDIGKLTGPARRGDLSTISRHKEILQSDSVLLELYTCITENILKKYENP